MVSLVIRLVLLSLWPCLALAALGDDDVMIQGDDEQTLSMVGETTETATEEQSEEAIKDLQLDDDSPEDSPPERLLQDTPSWHYYNAWYFNRPGPFPQDFRSMPAYCYYYLYYVYYVKEHRYYMFDYCMDMFHGEHDQPYWPGTLEQAKAALPDHWELWNVSGKGCGLGSPDCIISRHYPGGYSKNDDCTINFPWNVDYMVDPVDFVTEDLPWDYLSIEGIKYGGGSSPLAWKPTGGSTITWTSDDLFVRKGWKLCMRTGCNDFMCPGGWTKRPDSHAIACGTATCTDDDVLRCCERGCVAPVLSNESALVLPEGCTSEGTYSVDECHLECGGDRELSGWAAPQTCDPTSREFTLPTCKDLTEPLPWIIEGPCEQLSGGCVSSPGLGHLYSNNEYCKIYLNTSFEKRIFYRLRITYLDVKDGDRLHVGGWWWTGNIPDIDFTEPGWSDIEWITDGALGSTGWIVCAEASCERMVCPEGWVLDCDNLDLYCEDDCSSTRDVQRCCVQEYQAWWLADDYVSGQAADSYHCSTTTTTTTTIRYPDQSGYWSFVLGSDGGQTSDMQLENIFRNAFMTLGKVGAEDVIVSLAQLSDANRRLSGTVRQVGWFLHRTPVNFDLLEEEDILGAINFIGIGNGTNDTNITTTADYVEAVADKITYSNLPNIGIDGSYSSHGACEDTYSCNPGEGCWSEGTFGLGCGGISENDFCGPPIYSGGEWWPSPGSGFPAGFSFYPWVLSTSAFDGVSPQSACCTCGGGSCKDGSYRMTNSTLCIPCPAGSTTNSRSTELCPLCERGRYAPTAASSSCERCTRGFFGADDGMTACEPCSRGKFVVLDGTTACIDCAVGRTSELGSFQCSRCAQGRFANETGMSECEECAMGQFMPGFGATQCIQCGNGTYQGDFGQLSCEFCQPGTYSDAPGLTACKDCPPGRTSWGGEVCFDCPLARYADVYGSASCARCPAGTYADEQGLSKCKDCDHGTVAPDLGSTSCDECEPGSFYFGLGGQECQLCGTGSYTAMNRTKLCEACPLGRYMNDLGATECESCSQGTFSGSTGRNLCDDCPRGKFADEEGYDECIDCHEGDAQALFGSTACEPCDEGSYTRQRGQSQCLKCDPGRYSDVAGLSGCIACSSGSAAEEEGQTICDSCKLGFFSTTGAERCEICPGGFEALEEGTSECNRCEPGSAKAAGMMNCTSCEAGRFASERGLTECRACMEGEESDEGATACVECLPGRIAAAAATKVCEGCLPGRFALKVAATACEDCDAGFYADESGSSECSTCERGRFSPVAGLAFCDPCPAGEEAADAGSISCVTCQAGTFAALPGTPQCEPCSPGEFTDRAGGSECFDCVPGRFASVNGSSACALCALGSYGSTSRMTRCIDCAEMLPGEDWITMEPPSAEAAAAGERRWSDLVGATGIESCGCRPGTQPVGDDCEACGEGLICEGMGVLTIEEGYAWDSKFSVWDCDLALEEACPGGIPGVCKPGRDTSVIACARCVKGMVPRDDGSCVDCEGTDFMILSVAILVILCVAIGCYLVYDSPKRRRPKLTLILIVTSLGQFVALIQQLGIISLIRVNWTEPLKTVFEIMDSIVFLDWEVFRPTCALSVEDVTMFCFRIAGVFICLFIVCLGHFISQIMQHRKDWRTRFPLLLSALGTIILTFSVSIISTMMSPMQCQKHPNGRRTVRWYPSVICWEGGEHTTMILIGAVACVLPVVYFVACVWAVQQFPKKMMLAQTKFLQTWAFLFFRYTTEAYWYGPTVLFRNALVACGPVIPSATYQIPYLEVVMLASLTMLMVVRPWRVRKANYLDVVGHLCIVGLVMLASLVVDEDLGNRQDFVSTVGMIVILAALGILLLLVFNQIWVLIKSLRRQYQFFLCHHKLGAGCFCRMLKMWLLQSAGVDRKVFIDSDDLRSLDKLFDVVAHETETLAAIYSQALLTRPWCAGELTTAHRHNVKLMPVYVAGVEVPSELFIHDYLKFVPDISSLTKFGIDLEMIQEALRWFSRSHIIRLPQEIQDVTMVELCAKLVHHRFSEQELPSNIGEGVKRAEVIIIANKTDFEASATAFILRNLVNQHIQDKEFGASRILSYNETVSQRVRKVMFICTNGVFTRHVIDSLLTCELNGASILPVMSATNFVFPSQAWMSEQPCFLEMAEGDRDKAMAVVQAIFTEIAVDFEPSALSGTEKTLQIKAQEVARRLFDVNLATITEKASGVDGHRSTISSTNSRAPTVSKQLSKDRSSNLGSIGKTGSSRPSIELIEEAPPNGHGDGNGNGNGNGGGASEGAGLGVVEGPAGGASSKDVDVTVALSEADVTVLPRGENDDKEGSEAISDVDPFEEASYLDV